MARRLVVCIDGTSSVPERFPTNVLRIARGLRLSDETQIEQVVHYNWGVFTAGKLDAITFGAFGVGLKANLIEAYRFLVNNYESEDQIYIFGFSRGALAARRLAGMISVVGILDAKNAHLIDEAHDLYVGDAGSGAPEVFRELNSAAAEVEFLGVWETVGAMGVPQYRILATLGYWVGRWVVRPLAHWIPQRLASGISRPVGQRLRLPKSKYALLDARLPKIVKGGYHALAIDERRPAFEPTLWDSDPEPGQTTEQKWFAGTHVDVGGGNHNTGTAARSLEWMSSRAREHGLVFSGRFWRDLEEMKRQPVVISDSPPPEWRLAGALWRQIGVVSRVIETIDVQTLNDSTNRESSYAPLNLTHYLHTVGFDDPTARPEDIDSDLALSELIERSTLEPRTSDKRSHRRRFLASLASGVVRDGASFGRLLKWCWQHPFVFLLFSGMMAGGAALVWRIVENGGTGFQNESSDPPQSKPLWDWLNLLLVPLVLGMGAIAFNWMSQRRQSDDARRRDEIARRESLNQHREETLRHYQDAIRTLLLHQSSDGTKELPLQDEQLAAIARAHTLAALRVVDESRKGLLIWFLHDVGLLDRDYNVLKLTQADIADADISAVDFTKADLRRAFMPGVKFSGANLSSVDFSDATLAGADFSNANLSHSILAGATLDGADFSDADLSQANLTGATLDGTRFAGADLTKAILTDTNLRAADIGKHTRFVGAMMAHLDLHGVIFPENIDLRGADLTQTDLSGSDMIGANLHRARLFRVDLSLTDLPDAVLTDANLKKADLFFAKLDRCDISRADLTDTDFTAASTRDTVFDNAILGGSKGLTGDG